MHIRVEQISKQYSKKSYGLKEVSLEIQPGVCGLIGRNGAGKTTLMRIISGILEASSGKVYMDGRLMDSKTRKQLQQSIGYLPQEFGFYPQLSVLEAIDYAATLHGMKGETKKAKTREALEKVHLDVQSRKKIRELSGGMKRRLGIAQAIVHEPDILIVDEPTTGVDPEERISIRNMLTEYAGHKTVILSTHIIEDIAQSCKQVAVLDQGMLKYQGTIAGMIKAVSGVVWECSLPLSMDYKRILSEYITVSSHYMEDAMKLRVLGEEAPPHSVPVAPTAEDAYMWMIGGLTK
ncbi:ABC transporter ATP-binding protein [Paenibacillus sambharensis]|uniref:ABC transporter ATP-binding protein n=1 Tax=Paenibacillus sambharensis TaxID=1803190 RepID=A0A2W1L502_9BACL|nr:ATP-binding cassette domain-containing protein [Paenibacillus sambharensis]PZD93993.1 ABC transporter ATP-binding protein [Paenibacillus sambharensis]